MLPEAEDEATPAVLRKQLPLPFGIESTQTFGTFLAGGNAPAVTHLQALPGSGSPVYLWGPEGSGKTHLLHATAARWCEAGGRAAWFDGSAPLPWVVDVAGTLVVLDDCDELDGPRQHAAFTLFVDAATRGHTVIAAGRVPPVDLPLREDLRSRLGWGHVHALHPLSEAESRGALRQEADRRGLFLGDEVITYLLRHFERDLKHLTARLDALDTYSLAEKRAITVPLLRRMLSEEE